MLMHILHTAKAVKLIPEVKLSMSGFAKIQLPFSQ